TGKTRAITHRIAYGVRSGVYNPTSVLAVTFTARAAGEMRSRLRALGTSGVAARTFHAAALAQLRYFWPKVIGGAPGELTPQKASLVTVAAQRIGLDVDRLAVRDLSSEIEWAKVCLVPPDNYENRALSQGRAAPAGFTHQQVARLATAYEEAKSERGALDFEDVLMILAGILHEHRPVAEQVRRQYRHFVVDEYQDVSPLQQFLLDQWLGDRDELCVVGDPAQTIYSFTGATPAYLLDFQQRFPNASQMRLTRNYRSTPQVVHLANDVLRRGKVAGVLDLTAQRPTGPTATFTVYDDDEAEAAGVAAKAARLIAGGLKASEIAVLYRTQGQSEAFETALTQAGVGYQVRGGERFFQRKDVREAILLLRAAAHTQRDDMPMPAQVRDVLASLSWTDDPPTVRGAIRERWDALNALVMLADDLAAAGLSGGNQATISTLVADLDERALAQHAPTVERVTLATLHAAKGLEWDAVFLVGASEGLIPISLAETDEAVAEERRLLYVGITRARTHLTVSYAQARASGTRATRKRTRFLDGIGK
ncbi:MAG: ATP-dependent helicase, partial [Promicromonosporaceae bacterium]|nr:ATP-dependent helicase [Promicromonosporaceae bacterium]